MVLMKSLIAPTHTESTTHHRSREFVCLPVCAQPRWCPSGEQRAGGPLEWGEGRVQGTCPWAGPGTAVSSLLQALPERVSTDTTVTSEVLKSIIAGTVIFRLRNETHNKKSHGIARVPEGGCKKQDAL